MSTRTLDERGIIASGLLLVAVVATETFVRPRVGAGTDQLVDAAVLIGALALLGVSVVTLAKYYQSGSS